MLADGGPQIGHDHALLAQRQRDLVMHEVIVDECQGRALLLAEQRLAAASGNVLEVRAAAAIG